MSKQKNKNLLNVMRIFFAVLILTIATLLLYVANEISSLKSTVAQVSKKQQVALNTNKQIDTKNLNEKQENNNSLNTETSKKYNETTSETKKDVNKKESLKTQKTAENNKITISGITYNRDGSIDTSNWKTFSDKEFLFTFKYPSNWGKLNYFWEECYYRKGYSDTKKPPKKPCNHVGFIPGDEAYGSIFLAVQTPNKEKYGSPRDGYWGDNVGIIKSRRDVLDFCKIKKKYPEIKNCMVYTTKNGISVAKNYEQQFWVAGEHYLYAYYISSPSKVYPGIKLYQGQLKYGEEEGKKIIEEIIESLKFKK